MSAQGAAPGAVLRRHPGSDEIDGNRNSIPPDAIPRRILERLAGEGVLTLTDWRALGRRRREIFGVTQHWIEQLDELARERM